MKTVRPRNRHTPRYMRAKISTFRKLIDRLLRNTEGIHPSRRQAVIDILCYTDVQLARLHRWLLGPMDLLALTTRNLIETKAWTEYIYISPENAQYFIESEYRIDQLELLVKAVKATEWLLPPGILPERYREFLKIPIPPRLRFKRKDAVEENAYKLCSKYIHPSALLLGSPAYYTDESGRRTAVVRYRLYEACMKALFQIVEMASSSTLDTEV